ncbi:MAG: hypothetical protein WBX18_08245 [Terracidiphilus sp.]
MRRTSRPGSPALRALILAALPALLALAGCGGSVAAKPASGTFSISSTSVTIDTNCTGCNEPGSSGTPVERFTATLSSGGPANVNWSISPSSSAGTITSSGQYTPPGYLTADTLNVTVTATLLSDSTDTASATVTVTPGFLQPLTPENVALGASGTVSITGYLAEAGGTTVINFATSSTATGSSGGQGTVAAPDCVRSSMAFTYCTANYTAPSTVTATAATYVVATVGTSSSKTAAEVLLNTADVDSNPAAHQAQLNTPIALGSSGGNNNDFDTATVNGQTQVSDCCGGTLGSLIQNSGGTQYLLSCNHVLARSDQAALGEHIVQPGLIDDNCAPYGQGGTETLVGALTGFVKLDSASINNNVDAAIAQVNSGAVSSSGAILELGARQANGTLAAAPPGTSSTGGKGEAGSLNMQVAKSGRTTGLTCASIEYIDVTVQVQYYADCAETDSYYLKTYDNQIGIEGNQFSDAGDSGSLVVDTSNAEPVGLFFAGGLGANGVSEGIANPVSDVLSELSSQVGNGATYTFVGTTDHPVSCLNYGGNPPTVTAAQARKLSGAETARTEKALGAARALVNPSAGILGVAAGKSSDHIGEGAVIVYVSQGANAAVPQTIGGVRTVAIPTTAEAVAQGTAPLSPQETAPVALPAAVLNQAVLAKQAMAAGLMKQNPAFFGVGVGQSLDNPREAALVIYVDRRMVPARLPAVIGGLRTRYVIMDRLHVTRSYATGLQSRSRCMSRPLSGPGNPSPADPSSTDPFHVNAPPRLDLF